MVTIRAAEKKDIPALKALWRDVFGDSEDFLDLYFARYFDPAQLLCTEADGHIVSMSTVYRHEALLEPDGRSDGDCPCIFAVATDERYRGSGLAMELIRRQIAHERRSGTAYMMIAPAGESLFDLYRERFGFVPYFQRQQLICRPAGGCCAHAADTQECLKPISAASYGERREDLLRGGRHLCFSEALLELEADLCALSGGGLFEVGNGICAIERTGTQSIRVNELLTDEGSLCDAAEMIGAAYQAVSLEIRMRPDVDFFEAQSAFRRYPGTCSWRKDVPTAMILPLSDADDAIAASDGTAYAGFVFD